MALGFRASGSKNLPSLVLMDLHCHKREPEHNLWVLLDLQLLFSEKVARTVSCVPVALFSRLT